MNATLRRKPTFDAIFADPNRVALAELCAADRPARRFTVNVIQQYKERTHALGVFGIRTRARLWPQASVEADAEVIDQVGGLLHDLYAAHEPGNLRGILVEGLLCDRMRNYYAAGDVVDNAFVETDKNGAIYRTCDSPLRWDGSVDAAAWDQALQIGECHDCKVRAAEVDVRIIRELESNLPSPEFLMAVVTTNSYLTAAAELALKGYQPGPQSEIIAMEKLWDFTPLWRRAFAS